MDIRKVMSQLDNFIREPLDELIFGSFLSLKNSNTLNKSAVFFLAQFTTFALFRKRDRLVFRPGCDGQITGNQVRSTAKVRRVL